MVPVTGSTSSKAVNGMQCLLCVGGDGEGCWCFLCVLDERCWISLGTLL